jgi:uncharacterized membrane protein YhaH (DUF805 family)
MEEARLEPGWGWRALARVALIASVLYGLWGWLLYFAFGGGIGRYVVTALMIPLSYLGLVGGSLVSVFMHRRRPVLARITLGSGLVALIAFIADDSYFSTLDGSFQLQLENASLILLPQLIAVALAYWMMGLGRPPLEASECPHCHEAINRASAANTCPRCGGRVDMADPPGLADTPAAKPLAFAQYQPRWEWKRIVDFRSRCRPVEYWGVQFVIAPFAIPAFLALDNPRATGSAVLVASLVVLGAGVASVGSMINRLHDQGNSGWMFLLTLIPLIGGILGLVFAFSRGNAGPNRWGDPIR